jgi:hypothetical protein
MLDQSDPSSGKRSMISVALSKFDENETAYGSPQSPQRVSEAQPSIVLSAVPTIKNAAVGYRVSFTNPP